MCEIQRHLCAKVLRNWLHSMWVLFLLFLIWAKKLYQCWVCLLKNQHCLNVKLGFLEPVWCPQVIPLCILFCMYPIMICEKYCAANAPWPGSIQCTILCSATKEARYKVNNINNKWYNSTAINNHWIYYFCLLVRKKDTIARPAATSVWFIYIMGL